MDCSKKNVNTDNATAYIMHYSYINCCKILLASGIKKIIYDSDYKNDPIVAELLNESNTPITKINQML